MSEITRLLKILLREYKSSDRLQGEGLCHATSVLEVFQIITFEEYVVLKKYINKNRPWKYSSFKAFERVYSCFYWPPGDVSPRIKWLKYHILKNSIKDRVFPLFNW